nr:MAG: hypothetical protein 1 [Barnaviridae sp.]
MGGYGPVDPQRQQGLTKCAVSAYCAPCGGGGKPPPPEALESFPEAAGWNWPVGNRESLRSSLHTHSSKRRTGRVPRDATREWAVERLAAATKQASAPPGFSQPCCRVEATTRGEGPGVEGSATRTGAYAHCFGCLSEAIVKEASGRELSNSEIKQLSRAVNLPIIMNKSIQRDSHPGVPMGLIGASNGYMVDEYFDFLERCVVERLLLLLSVSSSYLESLTAFELVQRGFRDPVRTFIKGEPHSEKKLAEGRLRIISGVSVTDQLIERILLRAAHMTEISGWREIPLCPGMSLQDKDQEFLYNWQVQHSAGHGDLSYWDWQMQRWMMEDVTRSRLLSTTNASSWYFRLLRNQFVGWVRTVFQVADEMWMQEVDGIQESGSYRTSRDNSAGNFILQQVVAYESQKKETPMKAMGDDFLVVLVKRHREILEELGFVVKNLDNEGPGKFEYCSTRWDGYRYGVPTTMGKTLYRLLSKPAGSQAWHETMPQIREVLRHHPAQVDLLERLEQYGGQGTV